MLSRVSAVDNVAAWGINGIAGIDCQSSSNGVAAITFESVFNTKTSEASTAVSALSLAF